MTVIQKKILEEMEKLSPDLQEHALRLVHGLSSKPRGASIEDLLSLGGSLDQESAQEMREAIEEHCERIDPREW